MSIILCIDRIQHEIDSSLTIFASRSFPSNGKSLIYKENPVLFELRILKRNFNKTVMVAALLSSPFYKLSGASHAKFPSIDEDVLSLPQKRNVS